MSAKLLWSTPKGEELLAYMARVSNPKATPGDPSDRLIRYLIKHKHWSPFEMVSVCMELETTRDISRQVLRHRSFHFQEFSGRYAAYQEILDVREVRLQDTENRQNSLDVPEDDVEVRDWWAEAVKGISAHAGTVYTEALERGVAKEVARSVLPEGLVPTRMYMHGTLRDWIHYLGIRTGPETQKEHRQLAKEIAACIFNEYPAVRKALEEETHELR